MTNPTITLTTDFGLGSPYAGSMRGVILSIAPNVRLVDITHSVQPQDIAHGAWVLAEATPRFPAGTLHMAVVDPGVGTQRRIVYAEIGAQRYIAPDNGILSPLARETPPIRMITLTRSEYWLEPVSATFHGRDIMAPVAAHLSLGLDPMQLGEPLENLIELESPRARVEAQCIVGQVRFIDSFGNLITNITADDLRSIPAGAAMEIDCAGRRTDRVVRTYGEAPSGHLVALVGSGGMLELAIVGGNAARELAIGVGSAVHVRW